MLVEPEARVKLVMLAARRRWSHFSRSRAGTETVRCSNVGDRRKRCNRWVPWGTALSLLLRFLDPLMHALPRVFPHGSQVHLRSVAFGEVLAVSPAERFHARIRALLPEGARFRRSLIADPVIEAAGEVLSGHGGACLNRLLSCRRLRCGNPLIKKRKIARVPIGLTAVGPIPRAGNGSLGPKLT
jgi:hypothetical protein